MKIISGIVFTLLVLFYLLCTNFLEPTEIGIARNLIFGDMWCQNQGGWHITKPWILVSVIDTRPMRVAITSAGHGYSAKLISFVPENWNDFVQTEGFYYWWWANRISINFGYHEEYRGMRDIMRGYAYGIKKYSFFSIVEDYAQ